MYTKEGNDYYQNMVDAINYNSNFNNNNRLAITVGRVFGVITTPNTPTERAFTRAGGDSSIGAVFFRDYLDSKNIVLEEGREDEILGSCDIATPIFPNVSHYPLIGELVYILYLEASPDTQDQEIYSHAFYLTPINLWSNSSVNSQSPNANSKLGRTFIENPNIKNILNFEGDYIIQGRKGNSIRLGTTVKKLNYLNEWSNFGNDGDPITIISNNPIRQASSSSYYIENINEPGVSSIYLTSTQQIPLKVSKSIPKFSIKIPSIDEPDQYFSGSQVILNADRIVLNTKTDHLLLYSEKNIELTTYNSITLNADNYIHFNTKPDVASLPVGGTANAYMTVPIPKILLGTKSTGELPDEPLVLGDKLDEFLSELIELLGSFAAKCTATALPPEGGRLTKLESASETLFKSLAPMYDKIEGFKSKSNFTI